MTSINDIVDLARPFIEDERAKAGLSATIAANRQFLKFLKRDPAPTVDQTRAWVEANLVLLMWRAEEYTP